MKTLFTIPDKKLTYDCKNCGSFCCRGKGFGINLLDPGETELLQKQPGLKYFARPNLEEPRLEIETFADRCSFLDQKGLCGVQENKPFVCRFFPVNCFALVEDVLVVDIHTMCPLQIGGQGELIELGDIEAQLNGIDGRLFERYRVKDEQRANNIKKTIDHGGLFIEAKDIFKDERYLKMLTDLLGPVHRDRGLDEMFGILSGSLTLKLLLDRRNKEFVLPCRFLLALYLLAIVLKKLNGGQLGVRTLFDLYNKKWPLLYLLSLLDRAPIFIDGNISHRDIPCISKRPEDKLISANIFQQTRDNFKRRDLFQLLRDGRGDLLALQALAGILKRLAFIEKQ